MKVSEMKEALKDMSDDDEIIFWGWDGNKATSTFYPLSFTATPKFHKGYLSTYVWGYSAPIEPNVKKV
jgi:hypothetical protein